MTSAWIASTIFVLCVAGFGFYLAKKEDGNKHDDTSGSCTCGARHSSHSS